jgi:D-sedoheptulose 7-phosphate isomerase
MITGAMTGSSGGIACQIADYAVRVPSAETPRIQECHILAGHVICEIVEQVLCRQPEWQCDGESRLSTQELQKTLPS